MVGRDSYLGNLSVGGPTPYRYHMQYTAPPPRKRGPGTALADLSEPMGFVSRTFNAICSEQGVQCTVTSDPTDYRALFYFKNFGDRLVRIEYRDETYYLEPKEEVTFKSADGFSEQTLPKVEALNNGFDQKVLQEKFY